MLASWTGRGAAATPEPEDVDSDLESEDEEMVPITLLRCRGTLPTQSRCVLEHNLKIAGQLAKIERAKLCCGGGTLSLPLALKPVSLAWYTSRAMHLNSTGPSAPCTALY